MHATNVMIKPSSSACNLACGYCFYRDVAAHRSEDFKGMLSLENLEKLVANALSSVDAYCGFAFQGGEPTLIGLDFFRALIELQKKYNTKNVRIQNSLQTNGIRIDAEWARFLHDNEFLIGLSLDGPADVHNRNRVDPAGKDTFNRVMSAMRTLQEHKVDFNILAVVTGQNARHIGSTYRFFVKNRVSHLQFIPCLEPLEAKRGSTPWHLSPEEYGTFLVRLFDVWFKDLKEGRYTSVRHIDNLLGMIMGQRPEACNMTGVCTTQFVVEGDGSVYPCDFYVHDQWRLGTVDEPLESLMNSAIAREFVASSLPVPEQCKACRWGQLCRNGCRRDRFAPEGDGPAVNYFCASNRHFFDSRFEQLREACGMLQRMGL